MINIDETTRAGRMLAAGRVTVTFRSPSGQHITITAKCRKREDSGRWVRCPLDEAVIVFLEVPSSGGYFPDRVAKITARAGFVPDTVADPARVWCARRLLEYVAGSEMPAGLEVFEEDRCGRCGRELTDPVSVERGIGPECAGRATHSEHQQRDSVITNEQLRIGMRTEDAVVAR